MAKSDFIKVAVAQTSSDCLLRQTADKIIAFAARAKKQGCRVIVFPEGMLFSAYGDSRAEIDAQVERIRLSACVIGIYVIFGLAYKFSDEDAAHNRALAIDPNGKIVQTYDKIWDLKSDIPGLFEIDGVPACLSICADRWLRAVEELPAFAGAKLLIEMSANFNDEWLPELNWFFYVPRAVRNDAFVIFANQPYSRPSEEFMGYGPGHGHSCIISPKGKPLALAGAESDVLLTADLDLRDATLAQTERRRNHPALKEFWDAGLRMLGGEKTGMPPHTPSPGKPHTPSLMPPPAQPYAPLSSPNIEITIAAAQMACADDISDNVAKMKKMIAEAGENRADVVVFPELAVTGAEVGAIRNAREADLKAALDGIKDAARASGITVVFGMPHIEKGAIWNCAWAVGPDGALLTRHAELNPDGDLFEPGRSAKTMWLELKGAPAALTIGREALWNELAELAAIRGAKIHLHITNRANVSQHELLFLRQLFINVASYRTFCATVNAAGTANLHDAFGVGGGMSAIWEDLSRQDRRGRPIGHTGYPPYMAERIAQAGKGEAILYASRKISGVNGHYNYVSKTPQLEEWYKVGGRAIYYERDDG